MKMEKSGNLATEYCVPQPFVFQFLTLPQFVGPTNVSFIFVVNIRQQLQQGMFSINSSGVFNLIQFSPAKKSGSLCIHVPTLVRSTNFYTLY